VDVKEEKLLGDSVSTHWYYVSKGRALVEFLSERPAKEILDVGAGSGVFSRHLIDCGMTLGAVCVDPNYAREYNENYNGASLSFVHTVTKVSQELILMMDVLEHVDDDVGLLRGYSEKMRSGGRVVITVPAFQFLWSGHDVYLEHRRRYTLSQIENVAEQAGLRVQHSRYFFGILFPVAVLIRLFDKLILAMGGSKANSHLRPTSEIANVFLTRVHDFERRLLFPFNKMFGLTVFCLAVKD